MELNRIIYPYTRVFSTFSWATFIKLLSEYIQLAEEIHHLPFLFQQFGRTPLYLAMENGHVEAAELLIRSGATVDEKDNVGETAYVYFYLYFYLKEMKMFTQLFKVVKFNASMLNCVTLKYQ